MYFFETYLKGTCLSNKMALLYILRAAAALYSIYNCRNRRTAAKKGIPELNT